MSDKEAVLSTREAQIDNEIAQKGKHIVQNEITRLKAEYNQKQETLKNEQRVLEQERKKVTEEWEKAKKTRSERQKELIPFAKPVLLSVLAVVVVLGYFTYWGIKTQIADWRSDIVIYIRKVEKSPFNPDGIEEVRASYIKALVNAQFTQTAPDEALRALCVDWQNYIQYIPKQKNRQRR